MVRELHNQNLKKYPRITLHCACGNEFNINAIRLKDGNPVICQICGSEFPKELGTRFAQALHDLFAVKHELEKQNSGFDIAFLYKSTFKQPPGPYPFSEEDFEPFDNNPSPQL